MKNMSKNFRYGTSAVIYTAMVIVAFIFLNVAISALGSTFYTVFHLDMTKEQVFAVSDITRKLFAGMRDNMSEEDLEKLDTEKVKIVFMTSETSAANSAVKQYKNIYDMAKIYENEFPFIELEFIEPDKNPEAVANRFLLHSADKDSSVASINTSDIYFEGIHEGMYVSVPYTSFFMTDTSNVTNPSGEKYTLFNVEKKMTSSILRLFKSDSIAYLIEGHGEDNEDLNELRELLQMTGYTVETVHLSGKDAETGEEFEFNRVKGKIVIINSPKSDFTDTEIKKLRDFIKDAEYPHHLITFVDPMYVNELPEFVTLMETHYGMKFNSDVVTEDNAHTTSNGGKEIIPSFVLSEVSIQNTYGNIPNVGGDGLGYSFIKSIAALSMQTRIDNAGTIGIKAPVASSLKDEFFCDAILTSSASATKTDLSTKTETLSNRETILAVLGHNMIVEGNDGTEAQYTSYVIGGSSSSFISDKYLSKYANRDIMYSAFKAMALNSVDPEASVISYKTYLESGLTITKGEQIIWTIAISAVIPLAIAAIGTVVWVRRRHS